MVYNCGVMQYATCCTGRVCQVERVEHIKMFMLSYDAVQYYFMVAAVNDYSAGLAPDTR